MLCVRKLIKHGKLLHCMRMLDALQILVQRVRVARDVHNIVEVCQKRLRHSVQACPGRVHQKSGQLHLRQIQTL